MAVKVAKEGSLLVFPHTIPEMSVVAKACLNYLPNKRPTFLEIVQVSLSEAEFSDAWTAYQCKKLRGIYLEVE